MVYRVGLQLIKNHDFWLFKSFLTFHFPSKISQKNPNGERLKGKSKVVNLT